MKIDRLAIKTAAQLWAILLIVVFGLSIFTMSATGASRGNDLKKFYPNINVYKKNYLEGNNFISGSPQRNVLWFEEIDSKTFYQYNSGPEDPNSRCHFDELKWSGWHLRYKRTVDTCHGNNNQIVYEDPIVLLPRYWKKADGKWVYRGETTARYYVDGQLRCTGTNTYKATIFGWKDIGLERKAIHFRTKQTTTWETGHVEGGCSAGYTTRWQEDYYLGRLPNYKGLERKGIVRSVGGNLDNNNSSWDIWFNRWERL